MDTPKLVFYEHSFEDPIKTSLAKSVLNLGNECRALAEENQRLKHEAVHAVNQLGEQSVHITNLCNAIEVIEAERVRLKKEVERLNDLIISGGAVTPDASIYP